MEHIDISGLFTISPEASPEPYSQSPLPPSSPQLLGDDTAEEDVNACTRDEDIEGDEHEFALLDPIPKHTFSSPLSSIPPTDNEDECSTGLPVNLHEVSERRPHTPITPMQQGRYAIRPDDRTDSDPGVDFSSPAIARNGKSAAQVRREKGYKKLAAMRALKSAARDAVRQEQLLAAVRANEDLEGRTLQRETDRREQCFRAILNILKEDGYTWGEWVEWISSPKSEHKRDRFEGLFKDKARLRRILDMWVGKNSSSGRREMHSWAVEYTAKVVDREGEHATRTGILQSRRMPTTHDFILRFNLSSVHARLQALCPTMTALMRRFSSTRRQRNRVRGGTPTAREQDKATRAREKNDKRVGTALADLLGERSQCNSLIKHMLGLYLYATGAQRQIISVLSTLGICSSYPSIAGSGLTGQERDMRTSGEQLSSTDQQVATADTSDEDSDSDEREEEETMYETESGSDKDSEEERLAAGECQRALEDVACEVAARQACEDAMEKDTIEPAPEEPPASKKPEGFPLLGPGAGLLRRVSHCCLLAARTCAQNVQCGYVYDNINMMFRVAEQILGRKDSQENGTCATIFPLFDAQPEDMQMTDLLTSLDNAPPLLPMEILHTPQDANLFQQSLEHAVLRIVVANQDHFAHFRAEVDASLPATDDQIPLHQTDVYPLPAMNIDESSTTGNSEVMETMFRSLGLDIGTTKFSGMVRPIFGDQLSISRLCTLISNRAGHETLGNSYVWAVFGPGFFHHQMALTHGILETHWGDTTAGSRNPACLSFFNTILDRKPIVLSSLPPYRVCRDLIFHVLSGAVLHCLELVAGKTLEEYAREVTFDQLCHDTSKVLQTFASPAAVSVLRCAREKELAMHVASKDETPAASGESDEVLPERLTKGDMVFENASLFLRDALILREFTDALKGGYSGRIIRVLKTLTLMYRGCGRTKYAHELLHLVHNLTHVWPKPLRTIIIKNWLVNPTGKPNAWVPVDLLQEHMNFWIKIIYKAQGSNASWEWLQTISPCIALLRKLASQVNASLGARLGSKHHTPELDRDLTALQDSMRENDIFRVQEGRVLRGVKQPEVPNVISAGLKQLNAPLHEYNKTFRQLQRRLREAPLVRGEEPLPTAVPESSTATELREVPIGEVFSFAPNASQSEPIDADGGGVDPLWMDDDDEYWREFDEDLYEPRMVFAEEDSPCLDIDDM